MSAPNRTPAARRTCAELGVRQGLATPCPGCAPLDAQPRAEADTPIYEPADLWDLIWFYGVVALAALCTLAVVCGVASWVYASSITST